MEEGIRTQTEEERQIERTVLRIFAILTGAVLLLFGACGVVVITSDENDTSPYSSEIRRTCLDSPDYINCVRVGERLTRTGHP